MINQNINLIPVELRPQEIPMSAQHIMRYNLAIFVVIVLISATQIAGQMRLDAEAKALEKTNQTLTQRIEEFKTLHEKPTQDPSLSKKIEILQKEIDSKKQLHKTLGNLVIEKKPGFANDFIALAKQHVTGLWLTEIFIAKNRKVLRIKGKATQPQLVTDYLTNLKQEVTYEGKVFDNLSFLRDSENTKLLVFTLEIGQQQSQEGKKQKKGRF